MRHVGVWSLEHLFSLWEPTVFWYSALWAKTRRWGGWVTISFDQKQGWYFLMCLNLGSEGNSVRIFFGGRKWLYCLFSQQIFIEHLLGHWQCLEGQDAFAFIPSAVVRKKRGASSRYGHTSLQHVVVHTCYQILVAGPGWLAKCLAQRCSKCLALVFCARDSPLSWSMSL